MTQLSHVVSSRVMWLSMRARSPSARSPSTRRCASTPLGPIGPRSRAERCPPPTTPTVLAFSNRRPWSAAVGGTFCPVSSQGVWPYRRSIRSLQVARASVWSRAFRWDCSAGVVPVIDSFRVHALSPQASLAYPSGPVRGTGRSESQRRRADTRGCTLDSAAHVKPEHAAGAARPWLSVEQPTVHTDRPGGRTPSAYLHRRGTASGSATGPVYRFGACFSVLPCPDRCRFLRADGRVRGREAPAQQSREVRRPVVVSRASAWVRGLAGRRDLW